jgi:hypothetical protein
MPCTDSVCNCELRLDSKHCLDKMSNSPGRISHSTAAWPPFGGTPIQPAISSWLMAANAGSVTGSLAALVAMG